jgi:hypothetical protein
VVPAGLPSETEARLNQQRQGLDQEYYKFKKAADDFSAKPAKQQSDAEYEALKAWRTRYINSATAFNKEVTNAARSLKVPNNRTDSAPKPEVDLLGTEGRRVIKGNKRLGQTTGMEYGQTSPPR